MSTPPAGQPYPRRAISVQKMSPLKTTIYVILTLMSCGAWGIVWWLDYRKRRTVTRFK